MILAALLIHLCIYFYIDIVSLVHSYMIEPPKAHPHAVTNDQELERRWEAFDDETMSEARVSKDFDR